MLLGAKIIAVTIAGLSAGGVTAFIMLVIAALIKYLKE